MLRTLHASVARSGNISNLQELFGLGCVAGLAGLGRHGLREAGSAMSMFFCFDSRPSMHRTHFALHRLVLAYYVFNSPMTAKAFWIPAVVSRAVFCFVAQEAGLST